MKKFCFLSKGLIAVAITGMLAACGDQRAVLLPLQYPDGSQVTTSYGDPVMAGYQTYGSATHANATALYEQARPATCATCAKLGAVVTEPSDLRQITGFVGASTVGAGAIMVGAGTMDYGDAAERGKLADNMNVNNGSASNSTSSNSNKSVNNNANSNWNSNSNRNANSNQNSNANENANSTYSENKVVYDRPSYE
ncbi:MAG: hypothetical protein P4M13_06260 [Alphaproteobacteria bacterium]|nr:hypothetical protein [Alphaproteobacteria bacterium]